MIETEVIQSKYAVVDLAQIDKLRSPGRSKAIHVDAFVQREVISPVYYSDKHYYLLPEGVAGQRPYALLHQAMAAQLSRPRGGRKATTAKKATRKTTKTPAS